MKKGSTPNRNRELFERVINLSRVHFGEKVKKQGLRELLAVGLQAFTYNLRRERCEL